MIGSLYAVTRTFDKTTFKTKPSKPLTHTQGFIQWSANKTLFAALFITGSWLICSEIWAYPRGLMMKTAPSQKALHENKVPPDTMVRGASAKFHLKYPASDWLMPFQRQSKDLDRALPVLLQYLEAADDVCDSQVGILCPVPQQGRSGSSLSSTVCWDQLWVHPQPVGQPQTPLRKGCPCCAGMGQGAKGTRAALPFPPEAERLWSAASVGLLQKETEQMQELLLYLKLKRKESFFRFLENQKPWISASL